jgi:hypothetical protein
MLLFACEEDPVKQINSSEIRLVLTADSTEGVAPLTVHFTGHLYGKIDSLDTCVPAVVLCPGFGKTCIRYCNPDTTQPAKRSYSAEATYKNTGEYKAVMILKIIRGPSIYSDSLPIRVLR